MNDQELQDLREENELLLMQLHQVQEELEKYYLRNQELERRSIYAGSGSYANNAGGDKHEHLKTLIKRVRQIENSRSWWLTKPFRAFTRLILRKKKAQKPLADWAGVDEKIQFQERRLKQLEQSTYWRLMRPYRVVGDLFRHGPIILFGGRTKRELAEAQQEIQRLGVVLTAQHEELTQADRRQERFRQEVRAEAKVTLAASEKLKNQLLDSDKQKEDLKQRLKKIEEEILRSEAQMELLKNILEGDFAK